MSLLQLLIRTGQGKAHGPKDAREMTKAYQEGLVDYIPVNPKTICQLDNGCIRQAKHSGPCGLDISDEPSYRLTPKGRSRVLAWCTKTNRDPKMVMR